MKKGLVSIGILLSVLLVFTGSCTAPPRMKTTAQESAPAVVGSDTSLLVEADWLKGHMASTKIRIIDFGRKIEDYSAGHIPDAVFVDRKIVWDRVTGISGMLPSVDSMVKSLEKAGVGNDLTVVIYDDVGGLWASRLFWALEYLGHTDVHIFPISDYPGDSHGRSLRWCRKPFCFAVPVRGYI